MNRKVQDAPKPPDSYKLEDLREIIKGIAASAEKIKKAGISERALLTILQEHCPHIHGRRSHQKIPKRIIAAVIEGLETIEEYVFDDD